MAIEVGGLRLEYRRVVRIDRQHAQITAELDIDGQDAAVYSIHRHAKMQP